MKRRALTAAVLCAVLLIPTAALAQKTEEVQIPYGPPPNLNGEKEPGEWEGAFEFPLESIPLNAWAMHSGEEAYMALEVPSSFDDWESFCVWDDGDGEFYEEGDRMLLCDVEGCTSCDYTGAYEYACSDKNLPGAVHDGFAEVQVDAEKVVGRAVLGAILDGDEVFGDSFFDITLEPLEEAFPTETPGPEVHDVSESPSPEATKLIVETEPKVEPEITAVPTPPAAAGPGAGTTLGLCFGGGLLIAILFWLWWALSPAGRKAKGKAGEWARKTREALRALRKKREAEKKAAEEAKKKAKKAAKEARKRAKEITQRELDAASTAASKAEDELKKKGRGSTAAKNDLQAKARSLYNKAKAAESAAKAAKTAAQGASGPDADEANAAADDASSSAATAMLVAKKAWEVAQAIEASKGAKPTSPPWK